MAQAQKLVNCDRKGCDMDSIPECGFLRLPQVLSVIPLCKTSWWEGVRTGRFPKPVKLSARCTAWRAEDIRALIKNLSEQAAAN
jgi:predicted DNA-binding transcriptional regulator AlpA